MGYPNKIFGEHKDPYQVAGSNTADFPVGQVMETPDGRIFRYALNGAAATVVGSVYQAENPTGNLDDWTVTTGALAGATQIIATNPTDTITENEFAEGTLLVESTAGLGYIYPIGSNTADGGGGACTIVVASGVTFEYKITAGTHKATVEKNPWATIEIHRHAPTAIPVGISLVVIGIACYGWVQTHGMVNVLVDSEDTWSAGAGVRPGDDDAGVQMTDYDAGSGACDTGLIGWAPYAGVDTKFAPIWLALE